MSLLERSFIAITPNNVYITLNDVEGWIKQYGVRAFLRTFGISHAAFKYPVFSGSSDYPVYETRYGYEYIINDHYGNLIHPKHIIEAYLERHKKHTLNDRPRYLTYNPWSKKSRRKYNRDVSIHRILRQIHSVCAEDNEPGIRDSVRGKYTPWGFDSHREYEKCWKSQRKHQYKAKKDDL